MWDILIVNKIIYIVLERRYLVKCVFCLFFLIILIGSKCDNYYYFLYY